MEPLFVTLYVDSVPNRTSPPAVLLRAGWRESGKVRKRPVANLASWPLEKGETRRRLLQNDPLVGRAAAFAIIRPLPHGQGAAVLGTLKEAGPGQADRPEALSRAGSDPGPNRGTAPQAHLEAGHG